ncbi:unnamed protein product [Prunus armeniaca]|uniref:Uncharacterized protein n=1 Tax=Prunus armeniaca TaxID=36596 RepID=A0A6J5W021_PRUAR|nr:unnamed protein product [Prunus armeniaca]
MHTPCKFEFFCIMKLREEEKWQSILWRDTLIIMNVGQEISWCSQFSFQIFLSSRQKVLADWHQMQTVNVQKLSDIQCEPESQLKFITERMPGSRRESAEMDLCIWVLLSPHQYSCRQFMQHVYREQELVDHKRKQALEKLKKARCSSNPPLPTAQGSSKSANKKQARVNDESRDLDKSLCLLRNEGGKTVGGLTEGLTSCSALHAEPEAAIRGLKLVAGLGHLASSLDAVEWGWITCRVNRALMQQRRLVPERWRNVAGQIGHHRL